MPETTEDFQFDRYPDIHELLQDGGRPGVQYLLALGQNIGKFQSAGWALLYRVPSVVVRNQSMVLMGQGEPIEGASPSSWCPAYFIDTEADKLTGLGPKPVEVKGAPKEGPTQAQAKG